MKRFLSTVVLVCLLAMGVQTAAHAAPTAEEPGATVFIAPDGDDANDGTEAHPLATLEGARDAIRELKEQEGLPSGGVSVLLREGTYARTASFELGEQDSGSAEAPITYRSYPGETARLSGGLELDRDGFAPVTDDAVLGRIVDESARGKVLQFDLEAQGITDFGELSRHGYWKANDVSTVPPMELYVAGEGMTLARWPNAGTVRMDEILDVGPTEKDPDLQERGGTFSYTYDRPQYWGAADDVWLDGIFGYSWEWSYNKIESIDTEAKTITLRYGEMSGLMKTWFEDFHFAQNLLEELDAPGEYYIDRATGVLYFMPNAAFATTDADVTATMLKEPMIRTTDASHITFDELVMEYGRANAAVILGGSNVTVANSDVQNFADGGVLINSPGRYTYDGIPVNRGGVDHAVLDSHLRHIGGVPVVLQGGDKTTLAPGRNRVENSHIHDFAYYHKAYNPGVMFDGVGNVARGNEIHDAPHPGIIVHGNDHLIEGNEIYDICKTFQDLGAIYMNAGATPQQRGTVIRGNYFHDTGVGRLGVEGIYPDNLTMGLTIEDNIFVRMGNAAIKSGSGDHITARNNIFVDAHVPYDNYEMWMGDEPGNKVDTAYMPGWLDLFEANNGFVDTPYGEKYPELLTFFEENHYFPANNVFEQNLSWNPTIARSSQVNEHGARDVKNLMNYADNWVTTEDPGFVDWAAGDFRLTEDAAVFDHIPGFTAIPFEEIGTQGKVGHPVSPDSIALEALHLPGEQFTIDLGKTASFVAAAVPWNATNREVSYASSDPAVATIDAAGLITALAPGETTVTVVSAENPAITDEALVVVADGDGVMHFTDFESGGNGWLTDPNRSIVEDASGDRVYRIVNGANSQLSREFSDYVLEYEVTTPAVVPEGAVMLVYDRTGANPGGYVRYRHSEAGSNWTIYNAHWGTVKEITLPAGAGLAPGTSYDVRMAVQSTSIQVFVDGELMIEGANPNPSASGKVGFYVEKFASLDFDDVKFSIVAVPVTDIALDSNELTLEPGESRQLGVTVTPSDATNAQLDWSSDAADVATVDESGKIRAVASGTATITATSRAHPGITATVAVEVQETVHPVIDLGDQLADAAHWPASEAVDFDEGSIRISGEGVYGYDGETFGDGLLRFQATFGEFEGGWYGFSARSDRPGDPAWVNGNKGYLVVIKEDQIEFQSWTPAQTMMDVIPNTAIEPNTEHEIEFGAVAVEGGTRLVLRVDGVTVWSGLDTRAENPIADAGYLNVYHYGEANVLALRPVGGDDGSTEAPGRATLSNTSGWAYGLHDGNYEVVMNLWSGTPGTSFRLYENGRLVSIAKPTATRDVGQTTRAGFAGKPNGTYVYTGVLTNATGETETSSTTVTVVHAAPGAPVVSHDNWDVDGVFTATADLWWGTNATAYRLELDGVVVASGELSAKTPAAQRAKASLSNVTPGDHVLVAVFTNPNGETVSAPVKVRVAG
ncbi:Ig-like domain-containing protein [Agromyces cerinus]|uniref:Right handed beta helix region n=1 Tax=Agromyces cerinus subsp. cerinus TaxID=232089 RepID=A0A1N6IA05_9MICO|nr:Ig-like domain-containing protein [Agromyces cerinus]SIO28868.1 Right handed beta helix region [Agromyces cerinus subsp. cerinus]